MIEVLIFVLGAIIGSFLNVCIVRLPADQSVVTPRSHCRHCKKTIPWYDNIPLLSYLLLVGRCRFCREKISPRYWLVELLTGVSFVLFYRYFGLKPVLFPYLVMLSCFIVATFVDFKHRIIPDEISIGGMVLGLIFSFFVPSLHGVVATTAQASSFGKSAGELLLSLGVLIGVGSIVYAVSFALSLFFPKKMRDESDVLLWCLTAVYFVTKFYLRKTLPVSPADASGAFVVLTAVFNPDLLSRLGVIPFGGTAQFLAPLSSFGYSFFGLIVGGGTIYLMGILGDVLFRKESMGGGDVKLMALVGAFLGAKLAVLTFFIAPFFGAVYGIIEKIRTKDTAIAYGPFLALAALISLFWGDEIIKFIVYRVTPY